jgi:hypothetical protein
VLRKLTSHTKRTRNTENTKKTLTTSTWKWRIGPPNVVKTPDQVAEATFPKQSVLRYYQIWNMYECCQRREAMCDHPGLVREKPLGSNCCSLKSVTRHGGSPPSADVKGKTGRKLVDAPEDEEGWKGIYREPDTM